MAELRGGPCFAQELFGLVSFELTLARYFHGHGSVEVAVAAKNPCPNAPAQLLSDQIEMANGVDGRCGSRGGGVVDEAEMAAANAARDVGPRTVDDCIDIVAARRAADLKPASLRCCVG